MEWNEAINGLTIAGAIGILAGLFLRRYFARYDLEGLVSDSFWQLARGKRTEETPTDFELRLREINSAAGYGGKARRVAGSVIGHFFSKLMAFAGLLLILGGLIALGFGLWPR